MARLSVVQLATVNSTTFLRKFIVGVGRPWASTPSHCFPTKKFSPVVTSSSRWSWSLKAMPAS